MKTLFTLLFLSISATLCAQDFKETITIVNKSKTGVILPKKIYKNLTNDTGYVIVLKNVNSAHTSLKMEAKSKEIYTAAPELTKQFLPGISGSAIITKGLKLIEDNGIVKAETDNIDDVLKKLDTLMGRLRQLKLFTDSLHKRTRITPANDIARSMLGTVTDNYRNGFPEENNKPVASLVAMDVQYVLSYKEMLDQYIKLPGAFDLSIVNLHTQLSVSSEEIKKNEYTKCFDYLNKSVNAKDSVQSRPFTPNKDLVELRLMVIDTYSKDTLANEMRTLYSKPKSVQLRLGFSTGLFYTEMLGDKTYYLRENADKTMSIHRDKRVVSDVSLGAMAHLYFKATTWLQLGPGIGAAISPLDGKTRYLAGLTFMGGRENSIGISFGRAWAKTKQFSDAVLYQGQQPYLPAGSTSIPTVDHLKGVWFAGISYNLLSTRK